jgi:phosphoribosylformimino-5-aminoimidazole carboxamide ribotide isomerase
MTILPAIDLLDGQCVRLEQGDFSRKTSYSNDPVAVSRSFAAEGASWVHIVDLDGAKQGKPVHLNIIQMIVKSSPVRIELGGGITSRDAMQAALDAGVNRVILGSALIRDRAFADWALQRGDQVVCGLDARNGRISVGGWTEDSTVELLPFAKELVAAGARRFIVTDIATDGALQGPNLELMQEFSRAIPAALIASGGVSTLDDIAALKQISPPIEGVIVGKALYEQRFTLRQALMTASVTRPDAQSPMR